MNIEKLLNTIIEAGTFPVSSIKTAEVRKSAVSKKQWSECVIVLKVLNMRIAM